MRPGHLTYRTTFCKLKVLWYELNKSWNAILGASSLMSWGVGWRIGLGMICQVCDTGCHWLIVRGLRVENSNVPERCLGPWAAAAVSSGQEIIVPLSLGATPNTRTAFLSASRNQRNTKLHNPEVCARYFILRGFCPKNLSKPDKQILTHGHLETDCQTSSSYLLL